MKTANGINLTMLCDFYELTMGNGYFADGMKDRICYFDMFFRNVPDDGGYAVAAGLEQIVDYVQKLHFDEEDIAYLRGRGIFREEFLDYLKTFKFTATSGPSRRGRPSSPWSRWSPCVPPPSRRSFWRPICCWSSTTRA